jgi:hypothetical protein
MPSYRLGQYEEWLHRVQKVTKPTHPDHTLLQVHSPSLSLSLRFLVSHTLCRARSKRCTICRSACMRQRGSVLFFSWSVPPRCAWTCMVMPVRVCLTRLRKRLWKRNSLWSTPSTLRTCRRIRRAVSCTRGSSSTSAAPTCRYLPTSPVEAKTMAEQSSVVGSRCA